MQGGISRGTIVSRQRMRHGVGKLQDRLPMRYGCRIENRNAGAHIRCDPSRRAVSQVRNLLVSVMCGIARTHQRSVFR
jgi:hypothetical protein